MSFVAEASIELDVPPEVAFDVLCDHPSWSRWMPRSFEVASRADTPLHAGKRLRIRVARAPVATGIVVTVVDRPREITWRGGARGVLHAEHRFLFSSAGPGRTKVQSHETWTGALAPLVRRFVKPAAERIGSEQLSGLAAACLARR